MDEFHAPPASVGTGPELAAWAEEHARDPFLPNGYSGSANTSPFYHESQDMHNKSPSVEVNTDAEVSSVSMASPTLDGDRTAESLYRFPVSSSPVDIVTMLTRLATFTGVVLKVLTPKLKRHTIPLEDQKVSRSLSLSPSPPSLSFLPLVTCVELALVRRARKLARKSNHIFFFGDPCLSYL